MTISGKGLLSIKGSETAEQIQKYIHDAVDEYKVNGIIMGLSGGVDSALLSTLAVRTVGKDRVHVYYLHDKNSEKDSEDKVRLMAGWLGIKLNTGNITEKMRKKEEEAIFFKMISALPPSALPVLASLYYVIVGETPYITTLRKWEYKNNKFKSWVYNHIVAGLETMFDGPCAERRVVLEAIGKEKNLLLIGTGNRSEDLTGWFTIDGVDNMPVSPLKCLYKTQVIQLAEYLDIPAEIRKRAPSADVLRGATDTLTLGMSFDKIDIILYGIENNLSDDDIMKYGLTKNEIKRVRRINQLSAWRRDPAACKTVA